jgi:hypothetical protein
VLCQLLSVCLTCFQCRFLLPVDRAPVLGAQHLETICPSLACSTTRGNRHDLRTSLHLLYFFWVRVWVWPCKARHDMNFISHFRLLFFTISSLPTSSGGTCRISMVCMSLRHIRFGFGFGFSAFVTWRLGDRRLPHLPTLHSVLYELPYTFGIASDRDIIVYYWSIDKLTTLHIETNFDPAISLTCRACLIGDTKRGKSNNLTSFDMQYLHVGTPCTKILVSSERYS